MDNRTRNIPDGYYLTTDNSGELNDIFEKIANQDRKTGLKVSKFGTIFLRSSTL